MRSLEDFIKQHREDDVRQLALQGGRYPDVDMTFALQQIAGWQIARRKLPSWAETEGIVYPPHLSMEQCSSEQTARYKASVVSMREERGERREKGDERRCGKLVDLTGGMGVDFAFLAKAFDEAVYVEQQPHLCEAARTNFRLLGLENTEVVCGDSVEYLHQLDKATLIYLDPARRDSHGGRTYAITDCTPDVLALEEELLKKGDSVMVKLSPMLDWHKAIDDFNRLGDVVREVHIVSAGNECKELLLLLSNKSHTPLSIHCVNDEEVFIYLRSEERGYEGTEVRGHENCSSTKGTLTPSHPRTSVLPKNFLYEPNASIMKAGCFDVLQERLNVQSVGKNSHLFISAHFIENFPGRKFQISSISSIKEFPKLLKRLQLTKANVAVRNYPMSVNELRKRLKLKDGGDTYIFGTTLEGGKRLLLICSKVIKS